MRYNLLSFLLISLMLITIDAASNLNSSETTKTKKTNQIGNRFIQNSVNQF